MDNGKWMQRLKYRLDKRIAKGTASMVRMLLAVTILLIVFLASVIILFGIGDERIPVYAIWESFATAINAEWPSFADGSIIFVVVNALVAVIGLLFTSVLIGIITTGIETKLQNLRNGKSAILETDHTLILGLNDITLSILRQLSEANLNKPMQTVVILDDELEKSEMDDRIYSFMAELEAEKERICKERHMKYEPYKKHIQILCRSGETFVHGNLDLCNIQACRVIIINQNNDNETVKSIMACSGMIHDMQMAGIKGRQLPYITAVIREKSMMDTARLAGGKYLDVVCYQELMARIMANSCRTPGLAHVFHKLLDYTGNEIYFINKGDIHIPEKYLFDADGAKHRLNDLTLYEFNQYLRNATIIGASRG